jgi:hypothetical protein
MTLSAENTNVYLKSFFFYFQLIIEDADDVTGSDKDDRKSSFMAVTCNYINSIIGSGVIGKLSHKSLIVSCLTGKHNGNTYNDFTYNYNTHNI